MSFTTERFLIEAVEQCHLFKIMTYIKHGHNISIQNSRGQNLLIHVLKQHNSQDQFFEKKRFQVFQFLIKTCNLDPHIIDHHGKNVFNWAANLNCTQEALFLLRTYPGDINILNRDQSGLCSLHYAIEHGNEILVQAIVNYLLQYRLRFDIKDNHNNTPEELARKLGYEDLADYLAETSRSTVFLSREIQVAPQRPMTNKSKRMMIRKSSIASSSSSSSTSSSLNSLGSQNLIEAKIESAKNSNDWKTVAALRSPRKKSIEKNSNQLPISIIQISHPPTRSTTMLPKLSPIQLPTSSTSGGEPVHMLNLMQPQICPSYRQSFVPEYHQTSSPASHHPPPTIQRKMSTTSTHRLASLTNHRKRDSSASHVNGTMLHNGQPRSSLPPITKQRKQSIAPVRLADSVGMSKIRSKQLITAQN
ncbi:unnamed protein product [Adineta ricciae]|uniref:Uncharacterized protein n=1 Tax=Adineta ricciae TaxID=249248 RepID=A0A814CHD3_ADIRI|nr:unnamed protein product [Adineta ricciae]CAF0940869.1 unnamed protein product [Adineta ricciae]